MRRLLWWMAPASVLMVAAVASLSEAERPSVPAHRIVFELTSADPAVWESALNNVENVQKALGSSAIEVVAHGQGLALLTLAKNAAVRERLKRIAANGVIFAACENTMKRQRLERDDLAPFAITVDSGVAEVVRKQEAGWSYLRSGS